MAHFRLGMMYLQGGHGIRRHCGLAIDHFTSVGNAISLANAAWVMATCPEARYRNGSRALEISHALWLEDQRNPALLDQLAAAYAENGNFIEAITMQQKAIQVLDKRQLQTLEQFEKRLGYYQARKPFRDQFDD